VLVIIFPAPRIIKIPIISPGVNQIRNFFMS
jgi:hypothetical protein